MKYLDLFSHKKPIIGMVHLLPLPGTPKFDGNLDAIYKRAEWEAGVLEKKGVDGIIIENYGDEPFDTGEPTPDQLALMAAITYQITQEVNIPVGVNVHFNAWRAEMALAYACKADFVRVEVFVDIVVTGQGIIEPCSAKVTRYKKNLEAKGVYLWADVHPKFSRNLIPMSIVESAVMAEAAGADLLIVSGHVTGQATPLQDVIDVKKAVDLPVVVGSGTNIKNVNDVLAVADGAIVGSVLKEKGDVYNRVSPEAVEAFLKTARGESL